MAEYRVTPYVRAVLAELLIFAARDHLTTGLMYELWEIAREVGREDGETPWTAARNPFGSPQNYAGRFPDLIGADELRQLLYGLDVPDRPLPSVPGTPENITDDIRG